MQPKLDAAKDIVKKCNRIFFIGNGGSYSICAHMAEDYTKVAGIPSLSMADPSLLTCYANDYGYEEAYKKWLESFYNDGDLLVAISSSGESANILNATNYVKSRNGAVITLSGFKPNNSLSNLGDVNFHVSKENYGIVECFHQIMLHIILDSLVDG